MASIPRRCDVYYMENNYFVYILKCNDGTYYIGYTNDIPKRVKVHNAGKGAKYTRGRLPVEVVFQQSFETKSEALKQEYKLKRMTRSEKEKLIERGII
jgi:putative endonuclease